MPRISGGLVFFSFSQRESGEEPAGMFWVGKKMVEKKRISDPLWRAELSNREW